LFFPRAHFFSFFTKLAFFQVWLEENFSLSISFVIGILAVIWVIFTDRGDYSPMISFSTAGSAVFCGTASGAAGAGRREKMIVRQVSEAFLSGSMRRPASKTQSAQLKPTYSQCLSFSIFPLFKHENTKYLMLFRLRCCQYLNCVFMSDEF
jgi:hypothetical protein